jgi:hypothetical protein
MTLGDLLADLLDETPDVAMLAGREYARGSVAFAQRTGENVIELRLGAEIADAARRTPDTSASTRGDDWVRFAPSEWDEHACDRLRAWFLVAWRLAEGSR